MYKNIIFDLGGVVIEYYPRVFLMERLANEKLEEILYNISFGSSVWKELDSNTITRDEGYKIMLDKAAEIGHKYEMNMILCDWEDMLKNKDDTIRVMKSLSKNGYNLYYLSNMAPETFEQIKKRRFWPLFKDGVASCNVKISKPDARIFMGTLNKFKLNAAECIFIDDTIANVNAASALGITSIHFKSASILTKELAQLGVQAKSKK